LKVAAALITAANDDDELADGDAAGTCEYISDDDGNDINADGGSFDLTNDDAMMPLLALDAGMLDNMIGGAAAVAAAA